MGEGPILRQHDRYKASSYRSHNLRMPSRYDTCIWLRVCQVPLWDRTLVDLLRPDLDSLRILDVGCATGRLLQAFAEAGASQLFGTDLAPPDPRRGAGEALEDPGQGGTSDRRR